MTMTFNMYRDTDALGGDAEDVGNNEDEDDFWSDKIHSIHFSEL